MKIILSTIAGIAIFTLMIAFISGDISKSHTEIRMIEGESMECSIFPSPRPYGFKDYQAFCGTRGYFGNLEARAFIQNDGKIIRI